MRVTRVLPTIVRIRRGITLTTSYGQMPDSTTVLVEVDTDEGVTGFGQTTSAAPWYGDSVEVIIHDLDQHLGPALMGRDPCDIEGAVQWLDYVRPRALYAKSAIEFALWDLKGRALGVPVYHLLGGRVRDGISLHGFVHLGTPDQMATRVRAEIDAGWTVLKMKIGLDPEADLARYQMVREVAADRAVFQLDGNTGYTLDQAVPALTAMVRTGAVGVIEQPVRSLEEMAHLARILAAPLMADESLNRPEDAEEIAVRGAARVLHMKLHKFGGLVKARRIAEIAQAAGMQVSVAPYTDVELAAASHFAAATANATWPAGFTPMEDSILAEPIQMTGQRVLPRERPGLGVEIDRDRLASLAVS